MSVHVISLLISKRHMTWWVCPILEYSRLLPSDRSMCFLWLLQCFLLLVFFIPAFEGLETPGWPSGLVSWKDPWQAGYWSKHYSTIAAHKVNMEEIAQDKEEVLKVILPQYHQCWKVFSEHASHWFPSACKEDHAIVLKEGAPDTINCRVYHQTETELEATCVTVLAVTLARKVGPGLQDLQTWAWRILAERNAEKAKEKTWIGRMVAAESIGELDGLIKSRAA